MRIAARHHLTGWRQAFLTLAVLALLVKVAIPAGFMPDTNRATGLFAITLCTGQGPAVGYLNAKGELVDHDPSKHDPKKSHREAPCAFAGNASASVEPLAEPLAEPNAPTVAPQPFLRRHATPGRGLAAPPPPSHAPPRFA